jgi:hypothetical protein
MGHYECKHGTYLGDFCSKCSLEESVARHNQDVLYHTHKLKINKILDKYAKKRERVETSIELLKEKIKHIEDQSYDELQNYFDHQLLEASSYIDINHVIRRVKKERTK